MCAETNVGQRIAYYRVRALGLPVSNVTTTATIILPVITGIALRGAYGVALRLNGSSWTSKASVSWTAFGLFMLLVIYDTVLATLALTNMAPPNALTCNLERRWSRMFSDKNAQLIRGIQERHQCCGFRSSRDRAWPFPDRDHTAAACAQTFGRQQGCLGGWRQDMQITAGLILLVAAAVFLLKVSMTLRVVGSRNTYSMMGTDPSYVACHARPLQKWPATECFRMVYQRSNDG